MEHKRANDVDLGIDHDLRYVGAGNDFQVGGQFRGGFIFWGQKQADDQPN